MNTNLTPTEDLVLQLIAYEYSSSQIANLLFVSPQTVYTHRAHLLRKLNVKNSAGAVRRAIELSLLKSVDFIYQHSRLHTAIELNNRLRA